MADDEAGGDQENLSFLRTDDIVSLSCVATGERVCLAAEGFGNRICFLESISQQDMPPDIPMCCFFLEQAVSVRALEEMISSTSGKSAAQSGHRTLLYGHAVLLKHCLSDMYLSCLKISSSGDKLAFDVGLTMMPEGEQCWFTVNPASKQRSEGEKVRVGDDLILVSVATERYLHIAAGGHVNASFQQTFWTFYPMSAGQVRVKSLGNVYGGDVIRLFHGHMDECLTIPPEKNMNTQVMYETGAVCNHARSLWRVELWKTKWSGGFICFDLPIRLRHITSGRYLGVTEDNEVVTLHRRDANLDACAFTLRQSKDEKKHADLREEEGMGRDDVKYGETVVFVQHTKTGLWLSYTTYETKKRGLGRVEEKRAVLLPEGHMDDGLMFSRSQNEENRSGRVIRRCITLFNKFIRALEILKSDDRYEVNPWSRVQLPGVIKCLEDLIDFFAQPPEDIVHEERQNKLRALRNRQDLFHEEGMTALVLETIDKFSQYKSRRHFAYYAGEELAVYYDDISPMLYLLLAGMIKGNRTNCAEFSDSTRLDWLVNKLESPEASSGVVDVLHCVLIDSPEALNVVKEQHIQTIIKLIDKFGRQPKVLDVLCSLCVGNGVAVRANQNLICDNLLPDRDLLLQTELLDAVASSKPNIYIGVFENAPLYPKWYYELVIDHVEQVSHRVPVIRVGWANNDGYIPYPGGGESWGANGCGDDLFSWGFDGSCLWTAGRPTVVRTSQKFLEKGDVVGCYIDLSPTASKMTFTVNGIRIRGFFKDFNLTGMFYPVVSLSAKVSCRFVFGGDHGKLRYGPIEDFACLYEAIEPHCELAIEPCFQFGDYPKGVVCGPTEYYDIKPFIPTPIETSHITLPSYVENVRDKLADNIHEMWAMNKIEQGWTFGEFRDDVNRRHPCLTTFDRLPQQERHYDIMLAYETLRTLLALGYHITIDVAKTKGVRLKTTRLPQHFLQMNGYKPAPLDLSGIELKGHLSDIIEQLAENTHNVWARDRIQQGWTYGYVENLEHKRTPFLVPYQNVDDNIKRANRDTSSETVKTLLAYGYSLEKPGGETSDGGEAQKECIDRKERRIFRTEATYAVHKGKWYYEFELLTPGAMRVGWTQIGCQPNVDLGYDEISYAFDGSCARKWHMGSEPFGKNWQVGDVVGVFLNVEDKTISFSLNGEFMMDAMGQETAFKNINITEHGFVPSFSLDPHQYAKLNFGQDVNSLKFFTTTGLQEGYEPFCVNMIRHTTLWFGKQLGRFEPVTADHPRLEIVRIHGGSSSPPMLLVVSKTFGTLEKVQLDFLRLSLPVRCLDEFRVKRMGLSRLGSGDTSNMSKRPHRNSSFTRGGSFRKTTKRVSRENTFDKELNVKKAVTMADEVAAKKRVNAPSSSPGAAVPTDAMIDSGVDIGDGVADTKGEEGGDGERRLGGRRPSADQTGPGGGATSSAGAGGGQTGADADGKLPIPEIDITVEPPTEEVDSGKEGGDETEDERPQPDDQEQLRMDLEAAAPEMKMKLQEYLGDMSQDASSKKRGRSRFRIFTRKSKSTDPSPVATTGRKKGGKPQPFEVEDVAGLLQAGDSTHKALEAKKSVKVKATPKPSGPDYDGDYMELEGDIDEVDEHYFGVRVLPGQDPRNVWVGWVAPNFHFYDSTFDMKTKIRNVSISTLDMDYKVDSTVTRKSCYLVSAGILQQRYDSDMGPRRSSPGLLIGCTIDTSTGMLGFSVNGKEVANKFQVEPGQRLFPAVFAEPTNKEMLRIELGRTKTSLPLSAAMFRGEKSIVPQCPPRLSVDYQCPAQWSRVPLHTSRIHALKLSDVRGWSMLSEDSVPMMSLYIPEEDRSLDLCELIEHPDLLTFHSRTLELYRSICFKSNHKSCHALTRHVDEQQLMYCLLSEYLSGPIRRGFYNLLVGMHLEHHTNVRILTQDEFIIPMDQQGPIICDACVFDCGIPCMQDSTSIRPKLDVDSTEQVASSSPYFPMIKLKNHTIALMTRAAQKCATMHVRDPIGGSFENWLVPLFRLADKLLVMGLWDNADVKVALTLIDPFSFPEANDDLQLAKGVLHMKLEETIKIQICRVIHHLCDYRLRTRVEKMIQFASAFIYEIQEDQFVRYNEIKQTDMPPAIAAKKTKEFRCTPNEQVKSLLLFKEELEDMEEECNCREDLREFLKKFHSELLRYFSLPTVEDEGIDSERGVEEKEMGMRDKILNIMFPESVDKEEEEPEEESVDDRLQKMIVTTITVWAKEDFLQNQYLIRIMFSLLHRMYDRVGELCRTLEKTYVVSSRSINDMNVLLGHLVFIRSLLVVQADQTEEGLVQNSLRLLMDNKCFYQHPDLMRKLGVHETVIQLMVNTLNKNKVQSQKAGVDLLDVGGNNYGEYDEYEEENREADAADMVVMCCRFLCYFSRTSRANQRAMFDHLSYLLDNSSMLLSRPSLRGSCPLDVAYSSLMDNTELALALRDDHLEKISLYLSRCGLNSNNEMLSKGYPEIGWDPVEGERYLDFLRFCVWVAGESVEENANLVVRLLIRRPECLGPALRAESGGGGLFKAMKDGIKMSEQIALSRGNTGFLAAIADDEASAEQCLGHCKYDFSTLPPEDDEDYIDMGNAVLTFYSVLVDLLGKCAPNPDVVKQGRSDCVRARAILRSLIPMEDLEGVLSLRFILPVDKAATVGEDGEEEVPPPVKTSRGMPPGLLPEHKMAIVEFLDRVYGIETQETFFRLLEDGFLPDLRAATTLDTASATDSDMALALNRFLCQSVLPILTNYSEFFSNADHESALLEVTLHTSYRLSKCKSLTKGQVDMVCDFLVSLTNQLRPSMMTTLLRRLVLDVPALTENTIVPLKVLCHHYERCGRFYGSTGYSGERSATEEERRLTMNLFSGIFDALAQRPYDPELFSKALPCLSAIGCALPPEYFISNHEEADYKLATMDDGAYNPDPADTSLVTLSPALKEVSNKFAEHWHDVWASTKFNENWTYGDIYDEDNFVEPLLKPYTLLTHRDQERYMEPVKESIRAIMAWNWSVEQDIARSAGISGKGSRKQAAKAKTDDSNQISNYVPKPMDLRNMTLTRELQGLSEKIAENSHEVWSKKKKQELEAIGGGIHPQLVPFQILTEKEKKPHRSRAQELLKYLLANAYRIHPPHSLTEGGAGGDLTMRQSRDSENDSGVGVAATDKRFAHSLLEKLLEYAEKATFSVQRKTHSEKYSRRDSFAMATEDVKFFGKVCLPLIERYFNAHKIYFISAAGGGSNVHATIKEKELVAQLFSKLAYLVRTKTAGIGHDVEISVRCLQVIVQAIDARTVVRNNPEMVRASLLPFFNNAGEDLSLVVRNLSAFRFSHVKGTITRGATSLNYVHMFLLPVLTSMFDHLGRNDYGVDLLGSVDTLDEIQVACYKILDSLYVIGTASSQFSHRDQIYEELNRHRPLLGECLAAFSSTFPVAFLEPDLSKNNRNCILFKVRGDAAEHSREAHEILTQLKDHLPALDKIVAEIKELAKAGGKYYEAPHVIEVTLPMLCSYLPFWWKQGPDNIVQEGAGPLAGGITTVTGELMNQVLCNVLELIKGNFGTPDAPWMNRIATRTQPIISNSTPEMLKTNILPLATRLRNNALALEKSEDQFMSDKRAGSDVVEREEELHQKYEILVRDIFAFYPLLIKYVDLHRSIWVRDPTLEAIELYNHVAEVFTLWAKSSLLKRQEANFVSSNEIDHMALIVPSQAANLPRTVSSTDNEDGGKKSRGRTKRKMDSYTSVIVACLKRLLPIGLNVFGGREQELVQQAKAKFLQRTTGKSYTSLDEINQAVKEAELDILEFVQQSIVVEDSKAEDAENQWQKILYKQMGSSKFGDVVHLTQDEIIPKIVHTAKVLHGLHMVEHPLQSLSGAWKKLISSSRKRAVMACFRMAPLHNIPRHRAVNLLLPTYKEIWLDSEEIMTRLLIDHLTAEEKEEQRANEEGDGGQEVKPDPLQQLIRSLCRTASKEQESLPEDPLFLHYAQIMSKSCSGDDEEEEEEEGDGEDESEEKIGASQEEQEMQKQQLLSEQHRLAERGAAEMVLMYISASKGEKSEMVTAAIKLGISILLGGNVDVQKNMLGHLKETKDVGFFSSVAGLMTQCSVLNLDAFERRNKAEGLGMSPEGAEMGRNLNDADFTKKLFRFLQLMCEGHNSDFQNYLRSQTGNSATTNLVICTVDYLLRLQESMMDFFWHYSSKSTIDVNGKDNFILAISVAKQVFASLTEYIQGPCAGNQLTLAHSRLWDAVGGFFYIFAHMQDKLSKDPDQLELLRSFMTLQKEMMIMLLSMLEGNVMNGSIGKQMVDTLVESQANVEMILKFFDIFLKMKDMTTSEAFMEIDLNNDGRVSVREFRHFLYKLSTYEREEIDYIMLCVDANQDGKVDFHEFTDRFHNPAKDIGFNVALLLTNLKEHMTNDPRLDKLLEKARTVLDYFEPYLGCIEILGTAGRVERVYFEIKQTHIDQWEAPQIKESKRSFLHSLVSEEGDSEKLENFVNFCEDTIFEMKHAQSISAEELTSQFGALPAGGEGGGGAEDEKPINPSQDFYGWSIWLITSIFFLISPSNIRDTYFKLSGMAFPELVVYILKGLFNLVWFTIKTTFTIAAILVKFILAMMLGEGGGAEAETESIKPSGGGGDMSTVGALITSGSDDEGICEESDEGGMEESTDDMVGILKLPGQPKVERIFVPPPPKSTSDEKEAPPDEPTTPDVKGFDYTKFILSLFARNFYKFKMMALALAFLINMILLCYRFVKLDDGSDESDTAAGDDAKESAAEAVADTVANVADAIAKNVTDAVGSIANATMDAASGEGGGGEEGGDDDDDMVTLALTSRYLYPLIRIFAFVHTSLAFAMLVAYYTLKVPLVIFKREKDISRALEFDGMWIAEQPSEENLSGYWDKLVISTESFPDMYWDKFVKKKTREKYSEQYDYDDISSLLGMEKGDAIILEKPVKKSSILPDVLAQVDWQYHTWKWGVIFTDNAFLYIILYFVFSVVGNFNPFFFAAHLLDVAVGFKTLRTILQSVTHNGKQLVLTVMLLSIIVYIYTVIAFNFFRRFYVVEGEEGESPDNKCSSMASCFIFMLYKGVSSGGGIGDVIEPADGDEAETLRIVFDMSFFFFIIVILLAIIQGLIIDAFGDLRAQLQQVTEDMESKCFICGIGKEYFEKVPHGFDIHVSKEHNFANYLFFLMHLINKPETEFTGQETYVWNMYERRCWDFFPIGDCFRKQYESELSA